jgi:hypothetical protein
MFTNSSCFYFFCLQLTATGRWSSIISDIFSNADKGIVLSTFAGVAHVHLAAARAFFYIMAKIFAKVLQV